MTGQLPESRLLNTIDNSDDVATVELINQNLELLSTDTNYLGQDAMLMAPTWYASTLSLFV